MNLVYKHEKPLLLVTAVLAVAIWLALILGGTLGIVLLYLLVGGYVFFLFAHSAFISHLKGGSGGVRISREQYPDLYDRLIRCCEKVGGVKEVPEAYLLRTDFFNALATKFLGRHFVVLFTDVVDALEERPDAIDFYIGHELGHIHRRIFPGGGRCWHPLPGCL